MAFFTYPAIASPTEAGAAAGTNTGDLQFRGGDGNLTADADLNWNEANQELSMGAVTFEALKQTIINNGQLVESNLLLLDATAINHAIIEYSIDRGTSFRTGRLILTSDGVTTELTTDHSETSDPGVTITSDVSGSNIRIKYTSTDTGVAGVFKYTLRKW